MVLVADDEASEHLLLSGDILIVAVNEISLLLADLFSVLCWRLLSLFVMVVAVVVDTWIVSFVHAVAAFVVSDVFVLFFLLLLMLSFVVVVVSVEVVVVVVVAASAAVSAVVVAATAAATANAAADAAASKEWVGWIVFQRVFYWI